MSMYRYFAVCDLGEQVFVLVDGLHLLVLLQKLVDEAMRAGGSRPEGAGTAASPYVLRTNAHWLHAISMYKTEMSGTGLHYNLAGRLIKGDQRIYISDNGPVWRKGISPFVATADSPARNSALAVTSAAALERWHANQTNDDPSYQKFAQRIARPWTIFSQNQQAQWMDDVHKFTWDNVGTNRMLSRSMRDIMAHRPMSLTTERGGYNRHYSRMQHMLPVLVGAMFLAEPVRNARAWPINMMLLDLAETSKTINFHGSAVTWGSILWHPQALDVSRTNRARVDDPVVGNVPGPRTETDRTSLVNIPRLGSLHLVGGLLPASPTGGAKFGKAKVTPTASKIEFVHRKEIEVILTWLESRLVLTKRLTEAELTTAGLNARNCVSYATLENPASLGNTPVAGILRALKGLLKRRIESLDSI